MTLNDRNAPPYPIIFIACSGARCVEVNEDRHILSAAKDSPGPFSDVQN